MIEPPEIRQTPTRWRSEVEKTAGFRRVDRPGLGMRVARLICGSHMLDREKIVAVLMRRFPGSTPEQIATAANALVGLEDEWMEIPLPSAGDATLCSHGCYLAQMLNGRDLLLFSRSHRH